MKTILTFTFLLLIFCGCNSPSNTSHNLQDSLKRDPIAKRRAIDSTMKQAERPESEEITEGPEEAIKPFLASYNKIEKKDTLIIDGKDSLQVHLKYFCLHDSSLVIPKKLNLWQHPPQNFRVNNFAAKIQIIKNGDTIFNKTLLRNFFNGIINDDYKMKYAIIFDADFYKFEPVRHQLLFSFSISIPVTDLGQGVELAINKDGSYKLTD